MLLKNTSPPPLTLTQPVEGEELYLYLATSAMIVSTTLIRADEDSKHRPVYFVSKMLTDAETKYTDFERIALAFRMATKKLRPYTPLLPSPHYYRPHQLSDHSHTTQARCFGTTLEMGH